MQRSKRGSRTPGYLGYNREVGGNRKHPDSNSGCAEACGGEGGFEFFTYI